MNSEMIIEIRNAIEREKQAYNLYVNLMDSAPNHNVAIILNTIALEELKHESLLKEALRTGDMNKAKLKSEIRHDEIDIGGKIRPTLSTAGVRDALELAIKKEYEAILIYKRLKSQAETRDLIDLFDFLIKEEARHESLLYSELEKL